MFSQVGADFQKSSTVIQVLNHRLNVRQLFTVVWNVRFSVASPLLAKNIWYCDDNSAVCREAAFVFRCVPKIHKYQCLLLNNGTVRRVFAVEARPWLFYYTRQILANRQVVANNLVQTFDLVRHNGFLRGQIWFVVGYSGDDALTTEAESIDFKFKKPEFYQI